MPAEVEPPELALLIDFAERSREHDWSLRSALVRYAQPEPQRVSEVLESVRRIEFALTPNKKLLEREGQAIWHAITSGEPADDEHALVVGVLRAATELDQLGDTLAAWAVDRAGAPPDEAVDTVTTSVAAQLDALGVAREERTGPPRGGRSRG